MTDKHTSNFSYNVNRHNMKMLVNEIGVLRKLIAMQKSALRREILSTAMIVFIPVPAIVILAIIMWPQMPKITSEVVRIDTSINLVPHDPTDVSSQAFASNLEQVGQITPDMIANTNPPSIQLGTGEPVSFTPGQDGTIFLTLHNIPSGQCRTLIHSTPFNMDWQVATVNGNHGVESACFEPSNTIVVSVQVQ